MEFSGTWDEYFEHVVQADQQLFGPQYDWLLDWDNNKTKGDILFLKYEDLKADITSGITKIADFLNIKLSEAHLDKIVHDTGIKQMRSSPIAKDSQLWQCWFVCLFVMTITHKHKQIAMKFMVVGVGGGGWRKNWLNVGGDLDLLSCVNEQHWKYSIHRQGRWILKMTNIETK